MDGSYGPAPARSHPQGWGGHPSEPTKQEIRAQAARHRDELAAQGPEAAGRACARLADLVGAAPGDVIAGYRPIRSELDPTPFMVEVLGSGARVCVPVVMGKEQPLAFLRWTPTMPMQTGSFGVEIPATAEHCVPTVVVAPLLAWSRDGIRLGYGGGFYDRTLPLIRAAGGLRLTVGLAYAGQERGAIPHERHDARLDAVVTETETVDFRS